MTFSQGKGFRETVTSQDSTASFRSRSSSRGSQGRSTSPKAVCYDFLKRKCTRGANCKFLHKNKSPSPKPPDKQKKINKVCMYWKKGKCTRGDKCRFIHKSEGRHHHPDLQERRAPPPRLLKSQDLLLPLPREGQAEEGQRARGQRLPFTRQPPAMPGMPFKGILLQG